MAKNNKKASVNKKEKYVRKWGNQFSLKYDDEFIEKTADEMLAWFEQDDNLWLNQFAITQRFSRNRIAEFCKSNEYFKYIYDLCNQIQEHKLFKLGIDKAYNSAMPIFALKNVGGWKDSDSAPTSLTEEERSRLRQIAAKEMTNAL